MVRPSSGTGSVVERPTRARHQERPDLQLVPVPLPHPRRTLLQQDQILQSSGHPLRQTPGQLSRPRQTRSRPSLAPILWVHDLAMLRPSLSTLLKFQSHSFSKIHAATSSGAENR